MAVNMRTWTVLRGHFCEPTSITNGLPPRREQLSRFAIHCANVRHVVRDSNALSIGIHRLTKVTEPSGAKYRRTGGPPGRGYSVSAKSGHQWGSISQLSRTARHRVDTSASLAGNDLNYTANSRRYLSGVQLPLGPIDESPNLHG